MRLWLRATRDRRCGSCGATIARGAPMQEITMHQLGRALIRCPTCADSEVPADLPPLPTPPTVGELVAVGAVSREWMPFRDGGE